jgi:hypothetical protein
VKRKSLSHSTRFEVFKRDSFTCQYCGKKAPDIVLRVDHIHPVSKGGENDLMNLVTSCFECNSGKGAKTLGDHTSIEKQRSQLEDLQERREQLDMLMQWKTGLVDLRAETTSKLADYFSRVTGWGLSEHGQTKIRALVHKYSVDELTSAIDSSASTYLQYENGKTTQASVEKVIDYVERVARSARMIAERPELAHIYHARSIARKRCDWFKERDALALIEAAWDAGASPETLKRTAAQTRSWTHFRNLFTALTNELMGDEGGST